MIDPQVAAVRAAIGQAFDDVGIAPSGDEDLVEDFLVALREHGYIVIHEFNGTHPDVKKE